MTIRRALAGWAAACGLMVTGCIAVEVPEDNFFYPNARIEAERMTLDVGPAFPAGFETLSLPFDGGAVAATRVRTGRPDAPLIVFCGGNLFRRATGGGAVAAKLAPFGDVLVFDYPGYGDTPGRSDFATFRTAGEAVARAARAQADAEGRRLITWGHSLGGPVCAEIVSQAPVETHVFLSLQFRKPIYVSAGNRLFEVSGDRIRRVRGSS